jgi:hypothetical protein
VDAAFAVGTAPEAGAADMVEGRMAEEGVKVFVAVPRGGVLFLLNSI